MLNKIGDKGHPCWAGVVAGMVAVGLVVGRRMYSSPDQLSLWRSEGGGGGGGVVRCEERAAHMVGGGLSSCGLGRFGSCGGGGLSSCGGGAGTCAHYTQMADNGSAHEWPTTAIHK